MQTHHLKIWPQFFEDVESGKKPFELRKDDRNYAEGDILMLHEWDPASQKYGPRRTSKQITSVLRVNPQTIYDLGSKPGCEGMEPLHGLIAGFCILGLKAVPPHE